MKNKRTTAKRKTVSEDVGGSVQQATHATTGRKRQERRVASGNTRRGQAATERAVESAEASRPRARKRPAHR